MIYLEEQLSLIRYIQEWRGPLFDAFLRILNQFDTFAYYSGLISFIWVGISWRWGLRLGFLLVINGIVNLLAKLAFGLPRPYCFDSSLAVAQVGGFGFPSGGAQTAIVFGALLVAYWKSRWAWPCATLYVCLISFSRVALGVHFVFDLFGGWVLGLIVAGLFIVALRPVESFASRHPNAMLGYFAVPALLGVALFPVTLQFLMAIAIVAALGVYLSTKYELYFSGKRAWWKQCLHGLIGVAGAAFFGHLAKNFFSGSATDYLAKGIVGALWVSLLASPFCKKLRF